MKRQNAQTATQNSMFQQTQRKAKSLVAPDVDLNLKLNKLNADALTFKN